MYSQAQPRGFSATAFLYLAALRTAVYRVRAAANRVAGRELQRTSAIATASACESCVDAAGDAHRFARLAHLNTHVLKDIGAPYWLVARAAGEPDREHLRWIDLERR